MAEGYSAGDLARLLGVTPARLRGLVRALPDGGARERFSFQDLLLLRTARDLATSNVPSRRIRAALLRLRGQLSEDKPLTGVAIAAEGDHVVAREGGTRWQPDSGQVLMDFGRSGSLALVPRPVPDAPEAPALPESWGGPPVPRAQVPDPVDVEELGDGGELSADEWYDLGCELEEPDPRRALGAYRQALALDERHADAHVNLGRLLQERGDPSGAERHYRAALQVRPQDATAAYNLGTALEDQRRWQEAIAAYSEAISLHPGYADAHYNLARLYERTGEKTAALRHLMTARQIARR